MKPFATLLLLCCCLGLAACEEPEPATYPVTGEPCSPDDPVQGLDARDCVPTM
jgi:hypothetical protein